jgi:proline dehydrogenase
VDANYDRLAQIMIDGALAADAARLSADGRIPPRVAIASHDERRLASARVYAARVGLPADALEFQMIYGIRRDLQEKYRGEGFPLRVYIPYGIQWYPYFMRRLAERPANLWFFLSNLFRK